MIKRCLFKTIEFKHDWVFSGWAVARHPQRSFWMTRSSLKMRRMKMGIL